LDQKVLVPGPVGAMASTNKYLAQMNKPPKGGCGRCPKNALWTVELCKSDAGGGCGSRLVATAAEDHLDISPKNRCGVVWAYGPPTSSRSLIRLGPKGLIRLAIS